MAPVRAKRTRQKESRLSMRAFKSANKLSELTVRLTPSTSAATTRLSEDKPLSYSLPGSPVSKITPSLQPSPALSAQSDFPHSDINHFLLAPLSYNDSTKKADANGPVSDFIHFLPFAKSPKSRKKLREETTISLSEDIQKLSGVISGVANEQPEVVVNNEFEEPSTLTEASLGSDQNISTETFENFSSQPGSTSSAAASTPFQSRAQDVVNPRQLAKCQLVEPPKSSNSLGNTFATQCRPPLQQYPPPPGHYSPPVDPYQRYYLPMSYSNGYLPGYPYGPPPPRNGSPYQTPYGGFPGPHQLQRHGSVSSRGSNQGDLGAVPIPSAGDNTTAVEDDPGDLVDRISSVIPDIHMLLSRSKLTYGELGLREQLLRKAEADSKEAVRQKEDHISQLNKQLHDTQKRHEKENNKHRFSIANLEDKRKELEERLNAVQLHERASKEKIRDLEEQKTTLMRDHLTLSRIAAEERDKMVQEIESWKGKANELQAAKQQKTAEEQVRLLNEHWR
jgi:hypothetical protein